MSHDTSTASSSKPLTDWEKIQQRQTAFVRAKIRDTTGIHAVAFLSKGNRGELMPDTAALVANAIKRFGEQLLAEFPDDAA